MTIGDKVLIIANDSGHKFPRGLTVEITEEDFEHDRFLVEDKNYGVDYVLKSEVKEKSKHE